MTDRTTTMNQFGHAISVLNRSAAAYFTRTLKPYSIGPGQQAYLLSLQPEEQIHQDVLAHRLQVDKANVTRALCSLEKLGLIHREESPEDKRIRLIRLSSHGVKIREEVRAVAQQWIESLQQAVTQDQWNQLVGLLDTIAQAAGQNLAPLE